MNFYDFWSSLNRDEQEVFAQKSGYKADYISIHLAYGRKVPPLRKIKKMADASDGKLSFVSLCDFFINKQKTPSGN